MAREWDEQDERKHPRDSGGRFTTSGGRWASRLSDKIGIELASGQSAAERYRATSGMTDEEQEVATLTQLVNQLQISLRALPREDPMYPEIQALHDSARRRMHAALVRLDEAEQAAQTRVNADLARSFGVREETGRLTTRELSGRR